MDLWQYQGLAEPPYTPDLSWVPVSANAVLSIQALALTPDDTSRFVEMLAPGGSSVAEFVSLLTVSEPMPALPVMPLFPDQGNVSALKQADVMVLNNIQPSQAVRWLIRYK